jgi:hypothetical protein
MPLKVGLVMIVLVLLLILSFLFLSSCYTPHKAEKQIDKAYIYYAGKVADKARQWFPCVIKSSDTVYSTKDSVVMVNCPELPDVINMVGTTDTVINTVVKYKTVQVPVTLPIRYQVITKTIEDSGKIKVIADENAKLVAKNDKLEDKIDKRNKWLLWLLIGFIVSTAGHFIKFKLPFTK